MTTPATAYSDNKPDPQVQYVLDLIGKKAYPDVSELSVAAARALYAKTAVALEAPPEAVFRVESRSLPGPAGVIPVRIYHPRDSLAAQPVLIWLHGGGFVIGGLDTADRLCRCLARQVDCVVVSVDYRLAPEHKFPAAVDDAYAALAWVTRHAAEIGGDPARIAIGGDSAGANLATVCAILARNAGLPPPIRQLLVYPGTAPVPESPSHAEFAEGYVLTRRAILWFYGHYLTSAADCRDFRYAPLLTPSLESLPPALVIVAGCDPLRDEGLAYAERLQEAGNQVELLLCAGMTHGFLALSGVVDAAGDAIAQAIRFLHAGLADAESSAA